MSEQISGNSITKGIGGLISGALGGLLAWLNIGSSGIRPGLVAFAAILCGIGGVAFSHLYRRYLGLLAAGGNKKGSPSREAYDALRNSLEKGNIAARLYASRLIAFLDWIDRFFGDAGMKDRTLFPRAFGLNTPAPLWTAPAFDRCLLLALIYPITTIFIIWTVAGHVGPAEAALGLEAEMPLWRRGLAALLILVSIFAATRVTRITGLKQLAWLAITLIGFLVVVDIINSIPAFAVAGTVALAVSVPRVNPFFGTRPEAVDGLAAILAAFTIGAALAVGFALKGALASIVTYTAAIIIGSFLVPTLAVGGTFFGVWLGIRAIKQRWHGAFLSVLLVAMIVACLGAASMLPPLGIWTSVGPLLLFLELLTLLNAPFDWASLGLTRALLRRGLELGGWWPYFLGLVDAILAAVIIAILALTMVIGVQAFDGLAMHSGGKAVLPLDAFFDGIATNPTAPEYWWVYALLLSTMIPSLVNLMIGGASLLRGLPGLPSLLLRFMPAGKVVPAFERHWIALVLTLQIFIGAALGILAQAFLAVVVIVYLMTPFGLGLLDMARDVAAFNLPLRVGQYFAGVF